MMDRCAKISVHTRERLVNLYFHAGTTNIFFACVRCYLRENINNVYVTKFQTVYGCSEVINQ